MKMNEQTNGNGIMKRMQVRTEYSSEYAMHIQILGSINVNREYGYANELRAPPAVIDWLREQEPILESGASKGHNYYIQMDAVEFDDNTNALLIHGTPLNHEKGCLLGVNPSPVVTQVFDYAKQGESVVAMDKADAMSSLEGEEE
jgi:hypothetical protein